MLVGFLIFLWVILKRSLNSPNKSTRVVASPNTPSVVELASSSLLYLSLSSFVLPYGVFSQSTLFFPPLPFLIYSLLSGVQIINVSPSFMQSHFHQKSQGIITSSGDSLETCSRRQIIFGKDFLKALLVFSDYLNFSTSSLILYCLDG